MTGTSGSRLPRRGQDLHAADVRHAHVGEHDVGVELADALQARLAAVRDVRREAFVAQQDAERLENARSRRRRRARSVFGERRSRDAPCARAACRACRRPFCVLGRITVNRVPCALLSTRTRPRCASIARCTTARPSPLPLALVVKNGSNMRSRTSAGMPGPSSLTRSETGAGIEREAGGNRIERHRATPRCGPRCPAARPARH